MLLGQGRPAPRGVLPSFRDSSEASIAKARRNLSHIATNPAINLPSSAVDAGVLYYKMALSQGLTRSRCVAYVSVACLYIVCRLRKTAHLLIDFSEVTQTDVFVLGKVYQLLARELGVSLPLIDPCLYVERYGYKLNLGTKTRDVCHTAVRLVGRMKRDWIHHGRRPNGICGAALLVAAKLHGFQLSVKQMVRIVRISKSILVKRLTDVSRTPTASLSFKDFFSPKLESLVAQDPPSFTFSRINYLRRTEIERENDWLSPGIIEQVVCANQEMEVVMGIREAIEMSINSVHSTNTLFPIPKNRKIEPRSEKVQVITQQVETQLSTPVPIEPLSDSEEEIDDEEIDECILNSEEAELKSRVWHSENAVYLARQEERKLQKEQALTQKKRVSRGPRRKRMGFSKAVMDHLLEGKELPTKSSKIDYDVLERLNKGEIPISLKTGRSLETENFIDMFLDKKRFMTEVVDMRVPEERRVKYEEKMRQQGMSKTELSEPEPSKQKKRSTKNQPKTKKKSSKVNKDEIPLPASPETTQPPSTPQSAKPIQTTTMSLKQELYERNVKLFGLENFEQEYGYDDNEEEEFFQEFIY